MLTFAEPEFDCEIDNSRLRAIGEQVYKSNSEQIVTFSFPLSSMITLKGYHSGFLISFSHLEQRIEAVTSASSLDILCLQALANDFRSRSPILLMPIFARAFVIISLKPCKCMQKKKN
jgi:uncharacterized protein (DUF58 family)